MIFEIWGKQCFRPSSVAIEMGTQGVLAAVTSFSLIGHTFADTSFFLANVPGFFSARNCVQNCLVTATNDGITEFGCGEIAPCLCSDQIRQSHTISSWASKCALSRCENQDDALTAVGLFSGYCRANADANVTVSAPAMTTAEGAATPCRYNTTADIISIFLEAHANTGCHQLVPEAQQLPLQPPTVVVLETTMEIRVEITVGIATAAVLATSEYRQQHCLYQCGTLKRWHMLSEWLYWWSLYNCEFLCYYPLCH